MNKTFPASKRKVDDAITTHNADVINAHTLGFNHDLPIHGSLTITNTSSYQGSEPHIYFKNDTDDNLGWIDFVTDIDDYTRELVIHVIKPGNNPVTMDVSFGVDKVYRRHVDFHGASLINAVVSIPTSDGHIANKSYVDSKAAGVPDYAKRIDISSMLADVTAPDGKTYKGYTTTSSGYIHYKIKTNSTSAGGINLWMEDDTPLPMGWCGWIVDNSEERYSAAGMFYVEADMLITLQQVSCVEMHFVPFKTIS